MSRRWIVSMATLTVACSSPEVAFEASDAGPAPAADAGSVVRPNVDGGHAADSGALRDGGFASIDVPDPVHDAFGDTVTAALEQIVEGATTNNRGRGGVVLRVESRSQNRLFEGAGGETYLDSGIGMTPDTTFEIASVSKAFTAVVTLQLVDDGLLSLEDRVGDLLPADVHQDLLVIDGTNYGPQITVRQLLSHHSGLPHYWDDPPFVTGTDNAFIVAFYADPTRHWTADTLLPFIKALDPAGPPGLQFHYADGGYVVLGMVIEAVSGLSLHENYRTRLFEPLGLTSASLSYREPRAPGFEPSHLYWGDDDRFDVEAMSADWAGGGLVMNGRDLARFMFGVVGGYVLSPQSLDMLRSWSETLVDGILYGLGFYRVDYTRFTGYESLGQVYGHDGYGGAFVYYWPRENVVLSGTLNHADEDCFEQLIEPTLRELDRIQ